MLGMCKALSSITDTKLRNKKNGVAAGDVAQCRSTGDTHSSVKEEKVETGQERKWSVCPQSWASSPQT